MATGIEEGKTVAILGREHKKPKKPDKKMREEQEGEKLLRVL
ncbi:unnamed protein product [Cylicostephanus goldi]|uniref:Uncharacterized protein n=1 Tax=Cylicostephanus goldi TaxID=71465 RepID=A0A3P7N4N0_CYLGO|nr:unnamed protein product [Cylicostephanus goldi]